MWRTCSWSIPPAAASTTRSSARPRRAGRIRTTCWRRCSRCAARAVENEPLKIFMALTDVDRHRTDAAGADTVDRLARELPPVRRAVFALRRGARRFERDHRQFLDTAPAINQIQRSGRCAPMRPGRCRRWSGCGRSSVARAPSLPPMPIARFPAIIGPLRQGQERARHFRRRPRRRQGAAGRHAIARRSLAAGSHDGSAGRHLAARQFRRAQPVGAGHDPHLRGAAAGFARHHLRSGGQSGEPGQGRKGEHRADHQDRRAHRRDSASAHAR